LIQLGIQLETFTGDELKDWEVIEFLEVAPPVEVDFGLLMQTLQRVLDYTPLHPLSVELVQASLAHVRDIQAFLIAVFPAAMTIAYSHRQPKLAARIAEIFLRLETNNLEVLRQLAFFYQNAGEYEQGIATPRLSYSLSQELPDKIFANYQIIRGLMGAGGYWEEALSACQQQESLLLSLIEAQPTTLTHLQVLRLFSTNYFAPYVQDKPQTNKPLQNQLAQLCQTNLQICSQERVEQYRASNVQRRESGTPSKPIKIGYISHCLRQHSVGWLARWVLQHHDRERFEINGYFLNHKRTGEALQEWYISQVSMAYFSVEGWEIAEQIYKDEIDILIDLDSITLDSSCDVMALKPAPVQVTWLGWDASGIPAVDYFIADPYVLPESAQDYYTEKIWRLPQTYIAVDGFEVGVPTLRRDMLDIPGDAVVYLSSQSGYKRHVDTARLQMKILKEVPNSYFLIKGKANEES
ncbi:MAG: O-linked N-acetylglucosamine transferase, SPINDLY family protein, partial [Cyanobacteriota bacterium]